MMKTIQLQSTIVSQNDSVLEVLHDYISTRGFTVLSISSRDTPIRLSIVSIFLEKQFQYYSSQYLLIASKNGD